jgi:beta-aspartyl-peptidase (threonine type)
LKATAQASKNASGQGEYYIRISAAKEVTALMEYKGYTVEQAAREVVFEQIGGMGALGGIICLDKVGRVAMEFNTTAMFRAYGNADGDRIVKIFPE